MMKFLRNRRIGNNEKGMTLIELMAVVVILGIVATIAGAAVVNASDRAKISADNTTVNVLKDAAQRYLMDEGKVISATAVTVTANALIDGNYIRDIPRDSAGKTFDRLTVALDTTNHRVTWVFFNTDTDDTGTFAPKATNK